MFMAVNHRRCRCKSPKNVDCAQHMPDGVVRQAYGSIVGRAGTAAIRRDVRQNAKEASFHHTQQTGCMLYGFSGVILQGAIVTLELALSSVVLAVLIGLVGAGAKLSQNRVTGLFFEGYNHPDSRGAGSGINAAIVYACKCA